MARRYRVHYGMGKDGAGYVVTDSQDSSTGDWRGRVVYKTDSRSDAEEVAEKENDGSLRGL